MLVTIENSSYTLLSDNGNVETDRVISKEKENLILQLRVRNSSRVPVKTFSFVVAEFVIMEKVKEVLEHGWLQCSEVSFKKPNDPTRESRVFLQRDQNHFSFKKEYGYIEDSIISEWFTLIKMYGKDLFIGAVTTGDQFAQIFMKKEDGGTRVRVTCQYDGLTIDPGRVVYSEKIFFGLGEEEKVKKDFAESLAKHMNVKKVAPSIKAMCNSYYWNGNKIDEDLINNELDVLESLPEKLKLDYFQIDAGYTKYFGDWLDYRERFPDGFEPIIKRIKSLGYKPGIWFSPFAINPGTKLHDYHPGWFLKGTDHGHFDGRLSSPVDTVLDSVDLEVLDPTNEEVLEYLKKVLLHFKGLGFELFKIDFTYPVCLSNNYSKPVTRAQALRRGFEFMRKILGDESLILTCITQLSPIVGIADYVRTGIDSLNPFVCGIPELNKMVNEFMLEKNIKESEERLFLNGKVWRADPDMLIFRKGTGIREETIEEHKRFAKENNMSLWIGDNIAGMDKEALVKVVNFFNNA
jgi:hypothetical protein